MNKRSRVEAKAGEYAARAQQYAEDLGDQAQDTAEDLGRIGEKAGRGALHAGSEVVEGVKKGKLPMIVLALAAVLIVAALAWTYFGPTITGG